MRKGDGFLIGALIGAGLMYLLDPDRGGRRRALVRDQFVHGANELEDMLTRRSRDLSNRARGMFREARARVVEDQVDDRVLVERVRSEIGRSLANPAFVEVEAYNGIVTLSGIVGTAEVQEVVRRARGVRGVRRVENLLETRRAGAESSVDSDSGAEYT